MADYYTRFSLVLQLKEPSHQQYALKLAEKAVAHRFQDETVPEDFPSNLVDWVEEWSFATELYRDQIWLHSEEGGIDAVCAFIQHLLGQFDPHGQVGFQWSHDCSKPRTDAYGGGAAFITAHEIKTMDTSVWLSSVTP